ncbi:MAG: hypothetical protein EOR53_30655 [Mesorhizobium sp.]|nr:hypothetical protein EOA86_34450 [Mesorhizobium sp. M5C.F.Ca.IN.020.32.2.1]RWF91529.1 MAG: hypothetical protein EOQ45_25335 [Mesorhizobium sp.]RWI63069.1 MAG: hypothetical protein EOR18_32130 [Mesorhizobium sp.]RWK90497.1 MAG: hypothetical protein EOR53_30655 [Mesorhizobium sp.]TJV94761.1 MAG: hypothetical protein E5X52_27525 [Mesorhizobium sp.]
MGRGFLFGIAVGIGIGIYAAPMLGRPSIGLGEISQVLLPIVKGPDRIPDKATWPTSEQAKSELFRISKWDISKHGDGSTVSVRRCIRIDEYSIACELSAHLGWIEGEKFVESVFEGASDRWTMVAAKNR